MVKWLRDNPDNSLIITADGGAADDSWDDGEYFSSNTHRQHTNNRFNILKNAIRKAGGDPSRIIPRYGNVGGSSLQYDVK